MAQTTVQESKTIRIGSAKVEVGADVASLVNIGAIRGANIEVTYDSVKVESGNAGVISEYKKNMHAKASFELFEINLERIHELNGGLSKFETADGSPVTPSAPDDNQTIGPDWTAFKVYELAFQNGDGSAPTLASASGSSSGALAANDDYFIVLMPNGNWGIYFVTTGTATLATSETITLLQNQYTPAASDTFQMGSSQVTITPRVVRFTNTQNAKDLTVTIWYAANEAGLTFNFPDDNADEPMVIPVSMDGTIDPSRADKEQLITIVDEQRYAS